MTLPLGTLIPLLAVTTQIESTFATSSYVNVPATPTLPGKSILLPDEILLLTPSNCIHILFDYLS